MLQVVVAATTVTFGLLPLLSCSVLQCVAACCSVLRRVAPLPSYVCESVYGGEMVTFVWVCEQLGDGHIYVGV